MKRIALPLSIAVILVHWLLSAGLHLFRTGETVTPTGIGQLAVFVCVKTAVVLAVVVPLLRANRECLADLGFSWGALGRARFRGPLLAVGLFLITNVLANSLLASVGVGGSGTSPTVIALFRDPREAPLWVFCAVVGGGFNEELVRAFILTRFELAFGRWGLALAIVVDCVEFGMGHLYQGVGSAVTSVLFGLLCALIFLHRRRVADAMVAHAVFDLLGVAAAYALYGRGA
jgi:membrane protease YdiL (CAAX protease family)